MKTKIIYEPKGKALEYAKLAVNCYKGCSHFCSYCFAPNVLHMDKEAFHSNISIRKDALELLKKDVDSLKGDTRRILLSFTTDPYQPFNDEHGITRQAIETIKGGGINVEILTKGGLRACQDFDLLTPDDRFAVTLTFRNAEDSIEWEPNAALPADRLQSLRLAHKDGLTTWASLEPVIDPRQTLELIEICAPFVDLFKVGKLNYHKRARDIDWKAFGHGAVNLLEKLGSKYYIKNDLRKQMEGNR